MYILVKKKIYIYTEEHRTFIESLLKMEYLPWYILKSYLIYIVYSQIMLELITIEVKCLDQVILHSFNFNYLIKQAISKK